MVISSTEETFCLHPSYKHANTHNNNKDKYFFITFTLRFHKNSKILEFY